MQSSICRNNHKKSEIINMEIEGLGYIPICLELAEQLIINKKLICKRKNHEGNKICNSTADFLLKTKLGYDAMCQMCLNQIDGAVTTLLETEKYGEVMICNKYYEYIESLTPHQRAFMGVIEMIDKNYLFEPKSKHSHPKYKCHKRQPKHLNCHFTPNTRYSYFIDYHEDPESEHYYQDYQNYHIDDDGSRYDTEENPCDPDDVDDPFDPYYDSDTYPYFYRCPDDY